jgi:PAS domain S-box-containing protein
LSGTKVYCFETFDCKVISMHYLANAAHWMAVTFAADGLITSLSWNSEQLTGYASKELVGHPITHILADHTAFEISHMMESAREWGAWEGEIVHRSRSGKSLEAQGKLSLLSSRGNSFDGYLLISAIRNASRDIPGSNGDLSTVAARLRALSHELNNPLAVMMGFAQLILLNSNCSGKIRTDMEKVYSEMQRVINAVGKLHSYALTLQGHAPSEQIPPYPEQQDRAACS